MAVNFVTSDPFLIVNAEIEKSEEGQYSLVHARDLAKQTKEEFNVDKYIDEDDDYNEMLENTRQKSKNTKKKSNFKTIQLPFEEQNDKQSNNDQSQFDPTAEILAQSQVPAQQMISIHISIYDKSSGQELKNHSTQIDKSEFDTHEILNQLQIPEGYRPLYDEVIVDEKGYLSSNDIVTIRVPCDSDQKREVKKTYLRRIIPVDKNEKVIARTIEQKVEKTGMNNGHNHIEWDIEDLEFPIYDNLPNVDGMQPVNHFIDSLKIEENTDTVITEYITYHDLMISKDMQKQFEFKVVNGETGEIENEQTLQASIKMITNSRTNETFPYKTVENSPISIAKRALDLNDIQQAYYHQSQIVVVRKNEMQNDDILSNEVDSILGLLSQMHDEMPGLTSRSPYSNFESFNEIEDDEKFAKRFLSHINRIRNKLSLSLITYAKSNQNCYDIIKDKTPSLFKLPPEAIADREFAKSIRSLLKVSNDKEFRQHYLGSLLLEENMNELSIHLKAKSEKSLNNLVYQYEITINR